MRNCWYHKGIYLVLSILLGPAMLLAINPAACRCGKPTPESYKWNFSAEASQLLSQVRADSFQILNAANQLEAFDREPMNIAWQAGASLLNRTIPEVRALDRMQCRLRIIQRMTTPEQQAAIKRIVPQIIVLTNTMNGTLHFLNKNHEHLWAPQYAAYATELYNSASDINNDLRYPLEAAALHSSNPHISKS